MSRLSGEVVKATTRAPSAWANFTPRWPSPPMPTTPISEPGPIFQWRSGDQTVTPAQSSGAAPAGSRPSGSGWTKCPWATSDSA